MIDIPLNGKGGRALVLGTGPLAGFFAALGASAVRHGGDNSDRGSDVDKRAEKSGA
ncbi:MAG: hypothetical protein U0T82_04895 [Bacteroidales bacterium]